MYKKNDILYDFSIVVRHIILLCSKKDFFYFETILVACVYFNNLCQKQIRLLNNFQYRLFIGCLLVSDKYLKDQPFR